MANKATRTTKRPSKPSSTMRPGASTAEYQSVMRKEEEQPIRIAYERVAAGLEKEKAGRNRDLDPQLVWRGKDEQDWSDLVVHIAPGQRINEIIVRYFTPFCITSNGSKAVSLWR